MDKVEFDMAGTRYVGRVMKENQKTVLVEVPYTYVVRVWATIKEEGKPDVQDWVGKKETGLKTIKRHLVKHNVTPFS